MVIIVSQDVDELKEIVDDGFHFWLSIKVPIYYDPNATFKTFLGSRAVDEIGALHPNILCRMLGATADVGPLTMADYADASTKVLGGTFIMAPPCVLQGSDNAEGALFFHRETGQFQNATVEGILGVCRRVAVFRSAHSMIRAGRGIPLH